MSPVMANVGSKWVDGDLVFFSKTSGDTILTLSADGTLTITGFGPAAAQADSTATDAAGIVTDFNALLAKLRTAGLLET